MSIPIPKQEIDLLVKKDGKWRFCIDFKKLNNQTVTIPAFIPRIQDLKQVESILKYWIC